jgi:hypothetical protein
VHPEVEIPTERAVHRGPDAVARWAGKGFDHLTRRYEPVSIEPREGGVLVHAQLQYVWRESGEVGDSSPVEIELGIRDGLISSWRLIEDPA